MKNLFTLVICLFFVTLQAQIVNPDKIRFGKISDQEMALTSYPLQADAAAVVLFDKGELRMELDPTSNSFEYVMERHIRIKVLKISGVDYANFRFFLENSNNSSAKEEIIGTKGATYNLIDGKIEETKLTKGGIFEEDITDGLRQYSITFPQVKEGSLIELKYTLKSDFLFNLPTWYFQKEIPTDYSYFEAIIPEYYAYNLDMQGYASHTLTENVVGQGGTGFVMLTVDNRGGGASTSINSSSAGNSKKTQKIDFTTRTYRWAAQAVPALTQEPFAPNPHNFQFRISFELASVNFPGQAGKGYTRSWEDVSDTYKRSAGIKPYLNPKKDIEELSQSWVGAATDETRKVLDIYEGVKQYFSWNESFRTTVQENPGQLINLKTGNSAELNYMLLGALRAQGIPADPVLVSTRKNGYLSPARPSLTQFNHVIVMVRLQDSGQSFLLDATSNNIPGGLLPEYDLVQQGRLLTEEGSDWVEIIPPASEKTAIQFKLSLSKSGRLSGEGSFKMSDYAAVELRSKLDDEAAMVPHLQDWLSVSLEEVETTGLDNQYTDLAVSAQVDASDHVTQQGEFYYVPSMLAKQFAENPLKTESRVLPIDLVTPREHVYLMQLQLEEGLLIEELPETITLSLPDGKARYSIRYNNMNGGVQIIEKLTINEPFYGAEEYAGLRNFLDLVIENQQAALVIKRE